MERAEQDELAIGSFRFASNEDGGLIPVESGNPLQGFVVYEEGGTEFVRLQICNETNPMELVRYRDLWEKSFQLRPTSIFPEVIDCGEDDGIPYYVSKFPHGEPLALYLEGSPPWPGKVAARVICRFIASLRFQKEFAIHQHTISYESIWVEKTIYGPRLLVGDIALTPRPSANSDNAALMLSVFKDLTKEEEPDPAISALFHKLSHSQMSLGVVEKALKQFAIAGDERELEWSDEAEPDLYIDRCLAKIDRFSKENLYESKSHGESGQDRGFGRHIAKRTTYRSAIELDPAAKQLKIPAKLLGFCMICALISGFCWMAVYTDWGKSATEGISGKVRQMSYQPTLVPKEKPDFELLEPPASEPLTIHLPSEVFSPVSVNGNMIDAEGIVNGTFHPGEGSINTFSVSN